MSNIIRYEVKGEIVELSPELVKSHLTRGNGNVTNGEVGLFVNLCKYQQLNPFLNEAYLVKFGNQPAQIITGKEAFMKRAEAHPKYRGFQAGIIVKRDGKTTEEEGTFTIPGDTLLGGWAKVYREDRDYPVVGRVSLVEYDKKQSIWKDKPGTMIRKVAIVQALREAFPDTLGALYTEDEMAEPTPQKQTIKEKVEKEQATEVIDIDPFEIVNDSPTGSTAVKGNPNIDTEIIEADIPTVNDVFPDGNIPPWEV